jgi:hypothetical protein
VNEALSLESKGDSGGNVGRGRGGDRESGGNVAGGDNAGWGGTGQDVCTGHNTFPSMNMPIITVN